MLVAIVNDEIITDWTYSKNTKKEEERLINLRYCRWENAESTFM
jgi:ribosomal protein L33